MARTPKHDEEILSFLHERGIAPTTYGQIATAVGITLSGARQAVRRLVRTDRLMIVRYGNGKGHGNVYRVL